MKKNIIFLSISALIVLMGSLTILASETNYGIENNSYEQERRDVIGYQYKYDDNGRRMRRLYNFTTGTPLSDWEYY